MRTGTFEEMRYDALGRRVLRRDQRQDLSNQGNTVSTIDRYIWDGQDIIYEKRWKGGPADNLDGGALTSNPPLYGEVGYIHGRDTDQPVGLMDGHVLLANWRGLYQGSVDATGVTLTDAIDWPAKYSTTNLKHWGPPDYTSLFVWKGSLIQDQQDASGLMYRRNRFYDPQTGRFTQVDPAGIAAGINVYGFAQGDVVNFGDPFGLCPEDNPVCQLLRVVAGYGGGAIGGLLGGALGAGEGAACGPAAVVCSPMAAAAEADLIGTAFSLGAQAIVDQMWASSPTTPNALQKQVERGQAPATVDRVDKGNPNEPGDREPHIHFKGEKAALRRDGVWKEGVGRQLTNKERDWIVKNNWTLPKP